MQAESFYLNWLRNQVPLSSKVEIVKAEEVKKNPEWPAHLNIQCKFNNVDVVVQRCVFGNGNVSTVRIIKINNQWIDLEFDDYLDEQYKNLMTRK